MTHTKLQKIQLRLFVSVLLLSISFFFLKSEVTAQTNKAVIIDLSKCEQVAHEHSNWIWNGVDQLGNMFRENGSFDVEVLDNLTSERIDSLEKALKSSPRQGKEYDTLVVYLTGFVASQNLADTVDLTFALPDYQKETDQGRLSLKEISSMLSKSSANQKFLFIDTFGLEPEMERSRIPLDSMKGLGNFYMIASEQNGFQGLFWEDQQMSLFAYWMIEAIRGSADRSHDGKINFKELNDYLQLNIENLSAALGQPQSILSLRLRPSAVPLSNFDNDRQIVCAPRLESRVDAINRVADQLAAVIPFYGINRVTIPEFSIASGRKLSSAREKLLHDPSLLAKDLEGRLISKLPADQCIVYPGDRLAGQLDMDRISPEKLLSEYSQSSLGRIMIDGKPLSAMVVGYFKAGDSLNFTCGLVDITTMKPLFISNSLVLEKANRGDRSTSSDFPIQIQVKNPLGRYENRDIEFINDIPYVPLNKGEVYQIALQNKTSENVGFRVLVDGMNTHPERPSTITPGTELPKGYSTLKSRNQKNDPVSQKRVPLDEANFWILKPALREDGTTSSGAKIKGFYSKIGGSEGSVYKEFTVTNASASEAAQSGYSKEIGVITVGVYTLRPRTRGSLDRGIDAAVMEIGTKGGNEEVDKRINVIKGMEAAEIKSLVYIRYVTPKELDRIKLGQSSYNDEL